MNRENPLDSLLLRDWRPQPRTRTRVTAVPRAAVPCLDVHNHLGRWLSDDGDWLVADPAALVDLMDGCGVELVVNLDGRWDGELDANVARYDAAHPGRFATFAHLDWSVLAQHPPARWEALLTAQLDRAASAGARGLKVWKDLGLVVRDADARLVPPDHPALLPVFAHAGALGLPVLIHTADPVAFFDPLDARNERLEELAVHPDWWFGRPGLPTFAELMASFERLLAATRGTTYVGAHVGGHAEDLDAVAARLRAHPNLCVDTGGRFAELGRTPRAFARLVRAFPDRVLFGTDAFPPDATAYATAFRFVETDDDAFDYAPGEPVPPQGRWTIGGAALDPALLPAFYRDNARRVLAGSG